MAATPNETANALNDAANQDGVVGFSATGPAKGGGGAPGRMEGMLAVNSHMIGPSTGAATRALQSSLMSGGSADR